MRILVVVSSLSGVVQLASNSQVRTARRVTPETEPDPEIGMYNRAIDFMSPGHSPDTVRNLMSRFRLGDRQAAGELVSLFYPELRRLAAARMKGEQPNHTWQPTGLVNELYLELLKVKALRASDSDGEAERRAFLSLAAHIMRRLLIEHSRPLSKRSKKSELSDLPDARIFRR